MRKPCARWYSRRRQVDLRFRHPLSIRAGERWKMPEMVFEKVSGDWHDAAKRYRAWYDSTHPAVGSAVPEWTRDMVGLLLVIMRQQNELLMWPYTDIPKLCDVAERNGLDCIGLYGWTVGGHDHLYPDYDPDPKMGGVPALKAGIAEALHRRRRHERRLRMEHFGKARGCRDRRAGQAQGRVRTRN